MVIKPTVIDLFCGAGGLSEGFRQAGFHVLAGNDFNEIAGQTYAATHLDAVFLGGPIQDITAKALLKKTSLVKGELDCLIGGPPCQAFSVYNHQRGMHDLRSHLFREYLRLVKGLSPKWIVMENVRGILSVGGGEAVRAIQSGLNDLGYRVEMQTLKAEEFGIPQERRRVVFIGTRTNLPIHFPEATHGIGGEPFVTIKQAIGDLPSLKNGEAIGSTAYSKKTSSDYQRQILSA
jgi:DNA (cytosine-5)-methyltransferase 1